MRKNYFFYSLLLASALVGCSSSDDVVASSDEDVTVSDGNPHYLAVSIADVNGGSFTSTTRADASTFVNGSTTENHVKNVRFYFFNSDGSAATVKKSGSSYINYLDWYPSDGDGTNQSTEQQTDKSYNVEDQTEATLVINTQAGDKLPTKMLAVVNFTNATASTLSSSNTVFGTSYNQSLGMTAVRDLTGDYAKLANDNNQFVMVTSTYATKTPAERFSTATITSDNIIKKTVSSDETDSKAEEEAKNKALANPVQIYVERNVGKVQVQKDASASLTTATVKINNTDTSVDLYPIKDKASDTNAKEITIGESTKSYYFLPSKWDLTATTEKAYLSKHIELGWLDNFIEWTGWYDPTNHRSYWGLNVQKYDNTSNVDDAGCVYGKDYDAFAQELGSYVYTNENAATSSVGGAREFPTQVVVTGTIYEKSGDTYSVATIGDYEGSYYTEDGMKEQMFHKVGLYTKDANGKAAKLDNKYITFITSTKANGATPTSQKADTRCTVQLAINGTYDSATKTWTLTDGTSSTSSVTLYLTDEITDGTEAATADDVETALTAAGTGLLYKDGRTYYWFRVPHIATKDKGQYGVVRNHYYVCNISNVIGLGTPVYDPDEIIYPETPVDVDTYIAAKVNILSWKNVEKDINLGE